MSSTPRAEYSCHVLFGLLLMLSIPSNLAAQERSEVEGYRTTDSTAVFVFSEGVYRVSPDRVAVTGQFRGWSQDMGDPRWNLVDLGDGTWELRVANSGYSVVPPGSQFKFRINDGEWMSPPDAAENSRDGNLVFLPGVVPPRLRAEIRGPRAVWVTLTGIADRPREKDSYILEDGHGNEVPVDAVIVNSQSELMVVPAVDLDIRRVHYLRLRTSGMKTLVRRDPWFRTLYSSKELGATVSEDGQKTSFRIFAPRADRVSLFTFDSLDGGSDHEVRHELLPDRDGVWEIDLDGDLAGTYYNYAVYGPDDPGDAFFQETGVRVSDPYARVSVDSFGPARVAHRNVPATPLRNGRPAMKDLVSYEVHVQDFADDLPVEPRYKGTFAAMSRSGLRNANGEPIGIDHLVDLGINAVHLMPVQEFLHYPDDEWRSAFESDAAMIAQDIATENYQWGYRTTHAFAIENRFRTRGTEYGSERQEFRDLVQAFHDRDIAVIVDLVPNHTGENMDGRNYIFNFNGIDRPFYYRTDEELNHIGPFGNEIKTEDRPMVQRWLIDQCEALIDEFGIDGFRIDLAGQIDEQSLLALKDRLGDDILIYGEPWIAPSDPDVAANPDWAWYKSDAPITYFQDAARDAFKGSPGNPTDKKLDRGYAGGNPSQRQAAMLGLVNGFDDELDPVRGINYLDIHDNWALADRFATSDWNGLKGVDEARYRLAATLLFTSLGPIVLHGGSEIMRSKGSAPLEEVVRYTSSGPLAFHGKRDTYNLRKANRFVWDTVGRKAKDDQHGIDYAGMYAFWRGLIKLRMSERGAAFRVSGVPPDGYYKWILPENQLGLGYLVNDQILVLMNADDRPIQFALGQVVPSESEWSLVSDGTQVDLDTLERKTGSRLPQEASVPGTTARIWVRSN